MAHDHEKITYGIDDVKELFDASVLTGTIVSVDTDNDKAHVNISGFGQINDVPIFYHCPGSSVVAGGSIAFLESDSVYILNKKGRISPVASDLQIVGFVDGLKSCEWNEEWDSTFCGNHEWTERISYYNDWKGINGIYYCDTAPTIETTLNGEAIHHLHYNDGPSHREPDAHVINLRSAATQCTRVIFKFLKASVSGIPHAPNDNRYICLNIAYRDQFMQFKINTYMMAYDGSDSPDIYPFGIEYDLLLDEGNPVWVTSSGAQTRIFTRTRRLVTAEWSCDYIRFRR